MFKSSSRVVLGCVDAIVPSFSPVCSPSRRPMLSSFLLLNSPGAAKRRMASDSSQKQNLPRNLVVRFVPQQEAWVVERMGKYNKVLTPGINFLVPIIDKIRYVQILKEMVIDIEQQQAITKDNVTLTLDGVLYIKVEDPYKASYGVEDPEYAVTQLAQTSTRSELGKLLLDQVFEERQKLNMAIVDAINEAAVEPWGIRCMRYEIRDIHMPEKVRDAMQLMVAAERKKRAVITESEGQRASEINVAEGVKRSTVLRSEAHMTESINRAKGEAEAILSVAAARAKSIEAISKSLQSNKGMSAASLAIAEQYVEAFSKLAKESNTLLLPANTGDVSSMVASALATLNKVNKQLDSKSDSAPSEDLQKKHDDW